MAWSSRLPVAAARARGQGILRTCDPDKRMAQPRGDGAEATRCRDEFWQAVEAVQVMAECPEA